MSRPTPPDYFGVLRGRAEPIPAIAHDRVRVGARGASAGREVDEDLRESGCPACEAAAAAVEGGGGAKRAI